MSAEKEIAPGPVEAEGETAGSGVAEKPPGVASQIVPTDGGEPAEAPPSEADETRNAVRALVARLPPGTLIDEKYRIQSVIGRGGMGVVMSARHEHLNRDVALKFLCMLGGAQEDLRARFRREAQVNAKLKNEHVTRVLDVGRWEGISFMVMERLEGSDLRRKMRETGGTIPLHTALTYALQLCEGIAEAHAHGIVHRDLKPANLFVTQSPDGSALIKIMDFGISKWKDDEVGEITKDGTVLGSPKYMAPEQLFGGQVDTRADIWSIAAICYEMISGRTPYTETTLARFCAEVLAGPPPALSSVAKQPVPPALSAVIGRCFERDVALRPQTVAELAGDLLEAVDSPGNSLREKLEAILAIRPRGDADTSGPRPAPALSTSGAGAALASGASNPSHSFRPQPMPNRAPKLVLLAGGSLALVGLVLLGATFLRGATAREGTTTATATSTSTATATATSTSTSTATATATATSTSTSTSTSTATAPVVADAPKPSVVSPKSSKPPAATAPRASATAPVAATGTPPTKSTKADDDIPTMR